jgi:tetratricopeptide (TPR) repeat protein
MVGGLPPDSVNVMAHRLLTMGTLSDALVTMYWAQARGDTLLLNAAAQRIESFGRPGHDPADRPFSQYGVASARAYQTLARGDTSRALGLLTTLPDSLCLGCILDELNLARLLEARGRYDDAEQILLRRPNLLDSPIKVLKRLELARVAERLGKKDEAVQNYQYVTAMWRRADPQLEPYLSEAKEALRRLLGEPK